MGSGAGAGGAGGLEERVTVPAMPMPLAILCCALNFIVPGLGTIIAGFSAFCCNRYEDQGCAQRCGLCSMTFGIALLQFLLTPVLFIGWIWSCVWGVFFVRKSEYQYANGEVSSSVLSSPSSDSDMQRVNSRRHPAMPPVPEDGMDIYGMLPIPDHVRYSVMSMKATNIHAQPLPPPPPPPPVYNP